MIQESKKFVSYIESRIQDNKNLYSRFHLGPFVAGQGLTIGNAIRRTLLSEIPAFIITDIEVGGANHEFAILPGIHETILNIILNLKKIVLFSPSLNIFDPQKKLFSAYLNIAGPKIVTSKDIKFPPELAPLNPSEYITTLNANAQLKIKLTIEHIDPINFQNKPKDATYSEQLSLNNTPKPIKQVNFGLHSMGIDSDTEYISLEIWTDGSISPKEALSYSLEKLTRIFYDFSLNLVLSG